MGPGEIANFETLGLVDLRDSDYFRGGTHMHLSHLNEDLEAWYINFDFNERVHTSFRPNLKVKPNAQTVHQNAKDVSTVADVRRDYRQTGAIGHSAALQTTSRLTADFVAADGTRYPKGTAIPIRADFNTLDNPFYWSEHRAEIGDTPQTGLHFAVFNPSSDDFHRNRLAMDGVLPGAKIPFKPRARGQGFNSILETNISIQGNRMNLVMKKVTRWAAIIAVPTAITGFYGQNLPYPGFGKSDGLWWSIGLIVGIGVILYAAFKRWEWI